MANGCLPASEAGDGDPGAPQRALKIFISYSHDSSEHADRVLALADRLRADGLDAVIDQYETSPVEGWPRWMDRQIDESNFVLMVCTETYFRRVMDREAPGEGLGVRWEGNLIYQHLYNSQSSNTKLVPVLFKGGDPQYIPRPVKSASYFVLSDDVGYDALYRRLIDQPKVRKPELGEVRRQLPRERQWRERPEEAVAVQNARIEGQHNLVVQAVGSGIHIDVNHPHLTLLRWHTRQRSVRTELDLLNPLTRAIPIIGRETESAALQRWLADDRTITARCLVGLAGSGKTRLALELCEHADRLDWFAGFVDHKELVRFGEQQNLAGWGWSRPTLIVVDHAAVVARALRKWLVQLAGNPLASGPPLRLLLLERHADRTLGWWPELTTPLGWDEDGLRDLFDPLEPIQLPELVASEHRRAILAAAMREASKLAGHAPPLQPPPAGANAEFDRRLAERAMTFEPVHLLMAGITAAKHGLPALLDGNSTEMAARLAACELGRIRTLAQDRGLDGAFLMHVAACVTLTGGVPRDKLDDMINDERSALRWDGSSATPQIAGAIVDALSEDDGEAIAPILPDLIGEAAILDALRAQSRAQQAAVVCRAYARAPRASLASVIRIAQDYASSAEHESLAWLDAIVSKIDDLGELVSIGDQLPERTTNLRERAATIEAAAVERLRPACAIAASSSDRARLSRCLERLARRLCELGRRGEALAAAEEAVVIARDLAQRESDAYDPDLARALTTLADRLGDAGRREEALATADEAVALQRRIAAAARPDALALDLARSIANRAVHLSAVGRGKDALQDAEEAVALHRRLAADRPEAFRPNLALSVTNLAFYLRDIGRNHDALAPANEAAALYRELAAARPDAYRPDLALTLNALAVHLATLDRYQDGLAAAQEAVAIGRELATARPDAYRPDLVLFLNTLAGRLRDLERWEQAIAPAEEAVMISRDLATAEPSAFQPSLALSLNNLATLCGWLGRLDEALACAREAVAIGRQLAAARPQRFLPDLATSLNNLAARLSALKNWPEAAQAAGEAAAIRRQLMAAQPNIFRPHLARSLVLLAIALGELQRNDDALAAAREAADIHRRLATDDPGTWRPDLVRSLCILADRLAACELADEALAADREGIVALTGHFQAQPKPHAASMETLVARYRQHCRRFGQSPDEGLLAPVVDMLQAQASGTGGPRRAQTSLAASVVATLVPFLAEVGTQVANKLSEATTDGCIKLIGLLRSKLTGEDQRRALDDLQAEPNDSDNQADMRKKLKQAMAADPAFREELQTMLEQMPKAGETQSMTIAGDGNTAT